MTPRFVPVSEPMMATSGCQATTRDGKDTSRQNGPLPERQRADTEDWLDRANLASQPM